MNLAWKTAVPALCGAVFAPVAGRLAYFDVPRVEHPAQEASYRPLTYATCKSDHADARARSADWRAREAAVPMPSPVGQGAAFVFVVGAAGTLIGLGASRRAAIGLGLAGTILAETAFMANYRYQGNVRQAHVADLARIDAEFATLRYKACIARVRP